MGNPVVYRYVQIWQGHFTHISCHVIFTIFLKKDRPSNYLGQWAVRLPTYCFDKDKGKYPCPCQNHVSVIGLSSKYQALSTK